MPVALPNAVDTTTTHSFSCTGGTCAINAGFDGLILQLTLSQSWLLSVSTTWNGAAWIAELTLTLPDLTTVLLESKNLGGSAPPASPPQNQYFAAVAFTGSFGPLRLGATFSHNTAAPVFDDEPIDAPDGNGLVLRWFTDAATDRDDTVAGNNFVTAGSDPPIAIPLVPVQTIFGLSSSAPTFYQAPGGEALAKVRTLQIDSQLLETAGLDDHRAVSSIQTYAEIADGDFDVLASGGIPVLAGAGALIEHDIATRDYAGGALTAPALDGWVTRVELFRSVQKTPFLATLPAGVSTYQTFFYTNYDRPTKNPPTDVTFGINAWGNTLWDAQDTLFILDQPSPITGTATYLPVTVTHKGAVEVDIPDGGRPSSWSINSGANGSVTENAGDTVFQVTNVAAIFSRTLKENWRQYTNPIGPDFVKDGYGIVRHNFLGPTQVTYPEDCWWWNSYSFLRLNITSTGTATLTLVVSGIDLEVFDPHQVGVNPTISHHNETRRYTVAVAAGTADYWIDLSFPQSFTSESSATAPMRRPRVDRLTLTSSAVGTFTLNACELSRRDSYANQTSLAYPQPSSFNGDWIGAYLRVDGEATVSLTFPDDAAKGAEREQGYGGAARFADPETSLQLSAEAFWQQLARIEGLTVTYSAAARQAFFRDSFESDFVTGSDELATFAKEETPGSSWSGVGDAHAYQPTHCLRVGFLQIPNGIPIVRLYPRKTVGGGIESVATVDGVRAGAAVSVDVKDAAGTTVATVTTDARGRIHYEPLRPWLSLFSTNGVYGFGAGTVVIRTRETSHVMAVAGTPSPSIFPFNLTTDLGDYWETWITSGDAWARWSSLAIPPFSVQLAVTNTGDVTEPRVAQIPRRRAFLVYTRAGPDVYERASDDDGRTWTAEAVTFAGAKHPDVSAGIMGDLLRMSWLANKIQATYQAAGDPAASSVFNFKDAAAADLLFEDDSFRVAQDRRSHWWLHARIQGAGTTSLWTSWDDARTWTKVADLIAAGSRPSLAWGWEGTLLAWCYKAAQIQMVRWDPGGVAAVALGPLQTAAGALSHQDDTASFAASTYPSRPWNLFAHLTGEGSSSCHWSGDDGESTRRF